MGDFIDLRKFGFTDEELSTPQRSSFGTSTPSTQVPTYTGDEIDLKRFEPGYVFPDQQENDSSFLGDLWDYAGQGANSTYAMVGLTQWAYGGVDNADTIAAHHQSLIDDPEYRIKFSQEIAPIDERIGEAWEPIKPKTSAGWLEALTAIANPSRVTGADKELESGIWDLAVEWGNAAKTYVTNPKATATHIVETFANMVPTLALGGAGFAAGTVTANPIVPMITGFVGMTAGTVMTTTGEKGFSVLREYGVDLTDAEAIREAMANDEIVSQIREEGAKKGLTIAAVDAVSMGWGGKILTQSGRNLEKGVTKAFVDAGVDVSKSDIKVLSAALKRDPKLMDDVKGAVATYVEKAGKVSDEFDSIGTIKKSAQEYVKTQKFSRRASRAVGVIGIETLGEGVGEYYGEELATGEGSVSEAMLESFASLGQSAATIGAIKAVTGTSKATKKILKETSTAQINKVQQGQNSGIDPEAVNKARANFNEANASANIDFDNAFNTEGAPITPTIAEFEEVLGDTQLRMDLDQTVEGLVEEEGYAEYQNHLANSLKEVYGEEVPVYVPLTPEDERLLNASETLPPETSTVEQAAELDGDYITVYTVDGKPVRTKVVKESATGTQIILDEDGSEVILDQGPLISQNPLSPDYKPNKKYGVATLGANSENSDAPLGASVSELSDEDLEIALSKAENNLAAFKGDKTQTGAYHTILSDMNALLSEQDRRNSSSERSLLSGYAIGSLDRSGIDEKSSAKVVRISVPSIDVVSRGNRAKGQIIIKVGNLKRAEVVPKAKKPEPLKTDQFENVANQRLGQIAQERSMEKFEEDFDAGSREIEVEKSKKTDPSKTTRATKKFNEGALSWIPTQQEMDQKTTEDGVSVTVPFLSKTINRFSIPTEKGRGQPTGDRETKRDDVLDYRNALDSPNSLPRLNKVLRKVGYTLKAKNKEIILTREDGRQFGLGTVRVQDYTIDEYLNFAEEMDSEAIEDANVESARASEESALLKAVDKAKAEPAPEGRVAESLRQIEKNFVTRKNGKTEIDGPSLDRYLDKVKTDGNWKKRELAALNNAVKRLRDESKLAEEKKDTSRPAPRHHIVTGTRPSGVSPGMAKVALLKGAALKQFHDLASKIIRAGERDGLLGAITGSYIKQGVLGRSAEGESITPSNILALGSKTDTRLVAQLYALASMLIYHQDSVSVFRPDSSLDPEAKTSSIGGYLKSNKNLSEPQFGKFFREVKKIIGEEAELVRIGNFEFTIHNDSINSSQLARRLGRLQAKHGKTYGFQTEFFVAQKQTITHNWANDPSGESLRDQIRNAGFSDLLSYIDNKRDAYLDLAEEYGATFEREVEQQEQIDDQVAGEQRAVAVQLVEDTNQSMGDDPEFALELVGDLNRLSEIQEALDLYPDLSRPEGLVEEDGKLVVSQEYIKSANELLYGRFDEGGQRLMFALAAEKLEQWVETKVRPKVQELTEDSENVKFRLPKGLSTAQKKLYRTAVSKFFQANDKTVVVSGDNIIASYPLMPSDTHPSDRASAVSTAELLKKNKKDASGININDDSQPFTEQILSGEKTIETRDSDSLRPYVGKRVGIVRTGKNKKATLVGYAKVGEPKIYSSKKQFRADDDKHLVEEGSAFDIDVIKYGYPLTEITPVAPKEISAKGIVSRKVPFVRGTGPNGAIKNVDVASWMQDRTRKVSRIAVQDYSETARDQIASVILDEIKYQLTQKGNAVGWYEEKLNNMMGILEEYYPELAEQENSRFMLKAFMAITSQSTDVDKNLEYAIEQYEDYRKDGGGIRIFGKGKANQAMKKNHKVLKKIIDDKGIDFAREFFEKEMTIKELNDRGYKVSGELMSYKGRGALLLGPKIGSFFGNLNGHFESLTADLWFSRTWNRITGNLMQSSNIAKMRRTQNDMMTMLKDAKRVKPHLGNYKRRELIANEELRLQWASEFTGEWSRSSFADSSEDKHLIKRYDEMHNGTIDAPRNGAERGFMREVMSEVQKRLKSEGTEIDIADLQALIWYHEKDLWELIGGKDAKSEATDYEQAARRILAKKYPDREFGHVQRGRRGQDGGGLGTQSESDSKRNTGRTGKTSRVAFDTGDPPRTTYAPQEPAKGGFFIARTKRELSKAFGDRNIANLERQGILKIVSNVSELPEELHQEVEDAVFAPKGLHDRQTGISYLIAENLAEGESRGALLHEVGTHFGLKRMLGAKSYANLIEQIIDRRKDKALKPYFDKISGAYGFLNRTEDDAVFSEDFIEEVIARIASDPNTKETGIIQELYSKIRAFLSQYFEGITLTTNDLQALTSGALRQAYKGRLNPRQVVDSGVAFALSEIRAKDQAELTSLMNMLRPRDSVFLKPKLLIKKLSGQHKNKEFSHNNAEKHENKKAKVKLDKALDYIQARISKLPKGSNLLVNFSMDGARSERFVHLVNANDGSMVVLRFGFQPIESSKLSMLGPVVDFSKMGDQRSEVKKSDLDRAINIANQGKLAKQHALSFYINYRLGEKPAVVPNLDSGLGRDNYKSYIKRLILESRRHYRLLVEAEALAIESGFLQERVTPVLQGKRVMFALPDQSTNDLSPSQIELINETNGRTERWSVGKHLEHAKGRWALWAVDGIVDKYRAIKSILGEDGYVAWMMMHLSDNAHGLLHAVLHFGRPIERTRNGKFDGYDVEENSRGLMDILAELEGDADRYFTWIAGHRAQRLMKEGREKNFSKDDIKAMKALGKGRTATGQSRTLLFAKTMKELSKFQRDILDIAVSAGTLDKDTAYELQTDFWIPFYRKYEEFHSTSRNEVRGPAVTPAFVNLKDVIRTLRGSELKTGDLLENLMLNWGALLNSAMKNRGGVAAVEAAEKMGIAFVIPESETSKIKFAKKKSRSDKYRNIIYVMKEGKQVFYRIEDEMVLRSLLNMNWNAGQLPGIQFLSKFKRLQTFGITASPLFKFRNLIRDTVHSTGVSNLSYNIFGNVATGWQNTGKDAQIYKSGIASGAVFEMGYLHDDPSAMRRSIKRNAKKVDRGFPSSSEEFQERVLDTGKKTVGFLEKGWDSYQQFGNRLENVNRISSYMNDVQELGHLHASFNSRDLLNFSSGGSWPLVQYLTNSVSFINARIQGLDKLARSGRDGELRKKLLTVIGTITLASVAYELGMEDDEEYQSLEDWKKETYWPIKIPFTDTWFLLPKPFEIGAIASMAQVMTRTFINESPEPGYVKDRLVEILTHQLAFDPRPQAIRPLWEVAVNKDSFRDRRIENIGWQISNKSKILMKHKHTSDMAVFTSELLNKSYPFGETPFSPVQIDYLINGYLGWIGSAIPGALEVITSPIESFEELQTKRLDQMYGVVPVGGLVSQSPMRNTREMALLYEHLKDMNRVKADYNHYKTHGMDEELRELLTESGDLLKWRKHYQKSASAIGKINKRIGIIHESDDMSPKEKRIETDKLIESKNNIARRLHKIATDAEIKKRKTNGITLIQDARGDASVETDYDVMGLQRALQKKMYGEKDKGVEDNLYNAIFKSEFRGLNRFNPFIRTNTAPKGGSSAYGPLQITNGLMKSAKDQMTLTTAETDYVERFIEQGEKFLKFGREPNIQGYEKKYDYGGEGDLTSSRDKALYKQVGKKLIRLVWEQSDGEWKKFLNAWRYGEGSNKDVQSSDKKYYSAFVNNFNT